VAAITQAAIRELASIRGRSAPITSCYLDVDGRRLARSKDLEHEVEIVLKGARAKADGDASVLTDLQQIEQYVRGALDRSRVRGVAIFACSAERLWQVVELPVPVRTRVMVNDVPAVGQLEAVLRDHEPIGVLMADRQRARMFVFELGELVERSELFEQVPRETDVRGLRDRGGDHPQVLEEHTQQHLRTAAQVAFAVWNQHPFTHLAIAAPDHLARQLEADLHPYLRERLCGRLSVPVTANHGEVLAAAQKIEAEVERTREARVVERLREAVAAGRKGVGGLADTVEALADHRVSTLVVSQGFSAPGWRCPGCGALAAMGPRCKRCGSAMREVEDLVEDAVEEALAQSCQVEICVGNADLDVMGRAGALLRY
jgi:peptide subunit release factor 1 (eRF1)